MPPTLEAMQGILDLALDMTRAIDLIKHDELDSGHEAHFRSLIREAIPGRFRLILGIELTPLSSDLIRAFRATGQALFHRRSMWPTFPELATALYRLRRLVRERYNAILAERAPAIAEIKAMARSLDVPMEVTPESEWARLAARHVQLTREVTARRSRSDPRSRITATR